MKKFQEKSLRKTYIIFKTFLKAFTLAEILIVLVVIGVLTSILLPVAIQSSPDEKVMKFKKGNATIGKVISELVNNEKYYADGDLGKRPNGDLIDGNHDGDITYFCETFADVVTTKEINCSKESNPSEIQQFTQRGTRNGYDFTEICKGREDSACKNAAQTIKEEIITPDGIVFYQTAPNITFGITYGDQRVSTGPGDTVCQNNPAICVKRLFGEAHFDDNEFDRIYKIFCMDVDGIGVGEDPFGYGIRFDGKVVLGERATEWMKKSLQKGED